MTTANVTNRCDGPRALRKHPADATEIRENASTALKVAQTISAMDPSPKSAGSMTKKNGNKNAPTANWTPLNDIFIGLSSAIDAAANAATATGGVIADNTA